MKHQLIELLKKANEGDSATPSMLKTLIQQYQMAQIGYLIFSTVLFIIFAFLLLWALRQRYLKKDWTVRIVHYNTIPDKFVDSGLFTTVLMSLIGLNVVSLLVSFLSIGPALAPTWYMIKDLIGR